MNLTIKHIRGWLIFFILALLFSGLTAFPIRWGAGMLDAWFGLDTALAKTWPSMSTWIDHIHVGVEHASEHTPFLFYGTDWLAFAHIVIAIAFIGPLRDPVRNIWVIEFGMIACVLVIPLALICGPIRGIPFFWQVIDCAFGIFGLIPLWMVHRLIKRVEAGEQRA